MLQSEQSRPDSPEDHRASAASLKQRPLSEAARRALEEAADRRNERRDQATPAEHGGRGGLEPVRYGDWEVKGLASDF